MTLLDSPESILQKGTKMYEESLRTVHTDFSDENENKNAWTKLLNRESGKDGNDEKRSSTSTR